MAKHMTQDDRKTLEARYNAGQSVAGIARAMQFNYSTITYIAGTFSLPQSPT